MKRERRDNPQLIEFSDEHLLYEVQMLYGSASALMDGISNWALKMASLEAFAIHLRNMLDFLYPPDSMRDDSAIAEDFFDDPSVWKNQRPQKTQLLIDSHQRTHKEVAHRTYARMAVALTAKPWKCLEILEDLTPALSKFAQFCPRSRIGPNLLSTITQLTQQSLGRSATDSPIAISTSAAGLTHTFDQLR